MLFPPFLCAGTNQGSKLRGEIRTSCKIHFRFPRSGFCRLAVAGYHIMGNWSFSRGGNEQIWFVFPSL